jgi:hypothetical protein
MLAFARLECIRILDQARVLWDQNDLIEKLQEQFERLPQDLRAELPLKRMRTIAAQEEEE